MTEEQISEVIAAAERFAAHQRVWPQVCRMWALTFVENFSKPFLRRLRRSYVFLPFSPPLGVPAGQELNGWLDHAFPRELREVFEQDHPQQNLPPWLPSATFGRLSVLVGMGVHEIRRRRHILQVCFASGFLVSFSFILTLDLLTLTSIKNSIEAGEFGDGAWTGFGYLWAMFVAAVPLAWWRRSN